MKGAHKETSKKARAKTIESAKVIQGAMSGKQARAEVAGKHAADPEPVEAIPSPEQAPVTNGRSPRRIDPPDIGQYTAKGKYQDHLNKRQIAAQAAADSEAAEAKGARQSSTPSPTCGKHPPASLPEYTSRRGGRYKSHSEATEGEMSARNASPEVPLPSPVAPMTSETSGRSAKDRAKDRAKAHITTGASPSPTPSPSPAASLASPSHDRTNEKRYLSDRALVVMPEGVVPGPFPMEGVDRPLSAAYLEDLETALLCNAQRAYNSCERAESLILQLKAASCATHIGYGAEGHVGRGWST